MCMYRGPLWNCPWNQAVQLGLGEGPMDKIGPMSQTRGTICYKFDALTIKLFGKIGLQGPLPLAQLAARTMGITARAT